MNIMDVSRMLMGTYELVTVHIRRSTLELRSTQYKELAQYVSIPDSSGLKYEDFILAENKLRMEFSRSLGELLAHIKHKDMENNNERL